jgi:hypothetical protein
MPPTKHQIALLLINEHHEIGSGGWIFERVLAGEPISRNDKTETNKQCRKLAHGRLRTASNYVYHALYPTKELSHSAPRKSTLVFFIEEFKDGGIAYTTGGEDEAEIHINTGYILDLLNRYDPIGASIVDSGNDKPTPTNPEVPGEPTPTPLPKVPIPTPPPSSDPIQIASHIRNEILGVVYHELVHVWQNDGLGTCPGGLIEGIADAVRYRSGYVPSHWQRKGGKDDKWDSAYDTTAFFLIWCEARFNDFSVAKVNAILHKNQWDPWHCFARHCHGEDVLETPTMDKLWEQYCRETMTWP